MLEKYDFHAAVLLKLIFDGAEEEEEVLSQSEIVK